LSEEIKDRTIQNFAKAQIIEKKSKFISQIKHVETEEEAISFIKEVKKENSQARHNVYAYIISKKQKADDSGKVQIFSERVRFSDDGEPSQTAGTPVLNALKSENLADVACVVTRYFGGILLGTGGLSRAYFSSVKAAIDDAKVRGEVVDIVNYKDEIIECDYKELDFNKKLIEDKKGIIDDIDYGAKVVIKARIPL
jgi:uncharacterized YigZ family protein